MILPHAHCITLTETPERTERLVGHLNAEAIDHSLFDGINAAAHGLATVHPYEVGKTIHQKHVGLCLSHWLLWRQEHRRQVGYQKTWNEPFEEDSFLVLEDDALFLPGWRERLAVIEPPSEWDMILLGSGNCMDKPRQEVSPGLSIVDGPQCTHAYLVRAKALPVLLEMQRKIWNNIDIALIFGAYKALNTYVVLPRLVEQHGQEIAP